MSIDLISDVLLCLSIHYSVASLHKLMLMAMNHPLFGLFPDHAQFGLFFIFIIILANESVPVLGFF